MSARVAVVLPVYNGAAHLREAIESVHRQTYKDWQLIIVDDGSQDESMEIARSLPHPRCRIIAGGPNLGLYGRLAEALASIEEEWVALLMQDDRPKPQWLDEIVRQADLHPVAAALWACEDIIDENGTLVQRGRDTARVELIEPGTQPWYGILRRGCIWQISGSLTRTDLFRRVPFRPDLPHCGDFDWLLRAIRTSAFLYYEKTLLDLRIHKGQASTGNLAAGRDVREAYSVVKRNIQAHPADLLLSARIRLGIFRARGVALRILAALRHGNIRLARSLAPYLFRFSFLIFVRSA